LGNTSKMLSLVKDEVASVGASLASASTSLVEATDQMQKRAEDFHTVAATRLDDLLQLLGNANEGTAGLIQLIEEIKLGAAPIANLKLFWGEALVEGEKLKDFLGSIDLSGYRANINAFIDELRKGTAEISQVMKFLGESQLVLAKQFAQVIELFKAGKVTLERVKDLVRQIEQFYPGSDLAELAGAIEDALRKGDL
jgi:DNA-binding ferritin-like protein (Dps family)